MKLVHTRYYICYYYSILCVSVCVPWVCIAECLIPASIFHRQEPVVQWKVLVIATLGLFMLEIFRNGEVKPLKEVYFTIIISISWWRNWCDHMPIILVCICPVIRKILYCWQFAAKSHFFCYRLLYFLDLFELQMQICLIISVLLNSFSKTAIWFRNFFAPCQKLVTG